MKKKNSGSICKGYLVIRNVLNKTECSALAELSDGVSATTDHGRAFRRTPNISQWGRNFELDGSPQGSFPILMELIGPKLRVDHDYCIFMQPGASGQDIHGGPMRYESDHWYHYQDGVIRNGLMVATWVLNDASPGDGGFVCIPGSHKTNFIRSVPTEVLKQTQRPDYVVQPELRAGDVLIFTEALIHGTAQWTGEQERRGPAL